jgi:GNAT superfamily N-acetyltransferase
MAWLGILVRVPGPERFLRQAGMIQSVYVRPNHRGRRIGAALVETVIATARERGLDYLGVHPSERSYPVYERAGFAMTRSVLELGLSAPRRPA